MMKDSLQTAQTPHRFDNSDPSDPRVVKDNYQQLYKGAYNAFGVIVPSPMVSEVLENKHGIINPVIDLNVGRATSVTPSGTNGIIEPTSGAVNDSNVTFAFDEKPEVVIVNGSTYRENRGWTWDGTNVTLDAPAGTGGDVYGLGSATELSIQLPSSGANDDTNVTYGFLAAPTLIVQNGKTYRSGHGWTGTTTVTMDAPSGTSGDLFGIL